MVVTVVAVARLWPGAQANGGVAAEPTASPKRDPAALDQEAKRGPDMPRPGASVDRVMRAHFHDALLIREAVIAGTPERAANPATVLA